jgi:hypothetical protein
VSIVKIKSMLMRLQNALGQPDLVEQMLLASGKTALDTAETQSDETVNLVIGYNGSPNSQVALDLTLWIAHQTRLATQSRSWCMWCMWSIRKAPPSEISLFMGDRPRLRRNRKERDRAKLQP